MQPRINQAARKLIGRGAGWWGFGIDVPYSTLSPEEDKRGQQPPFPGYKANVVASHSLAAPASSQRPCYLDEPPVVPRDGRAQRVTKPATQDGSRAVVSAHGPNKGRNTPLRDKQAYHATQTHAGEGASVRGGRGRGRGGGGWEERTLPPYLFARHPGWLGYPKPLGAALRS